MKKPLIVLTGPTAAGKTSLSISLAKAVNARSSRRIPCRCTVGMDIGSAKIRPEEMQGIPHYLIDVLDPREGLSYCQIPGNGKGRHGDYLFHGEDTCAYRRNRFLYPGGDKGY